MKSTLNRWIVKLISPFYLSITDILQVKDLHHGMPLFAPTGEAIQVRSYEPADLPRIENAFGETTARRMQQRQAASTAYLAFINKQVCGWLWITQEPRMKEGVPPFVYSIAPPNGAQYIYDCFTTAAARRQSVMTTLFSHLLAQSQDTDTRFLFFTHDICNFAMHTLARRYGFCNFGEMTYRRWLWWHRQDITALEKLCTLN